MNTGLKICGLTTPDAVEASADAGASHFGLVFFPKSPRNVGIEEAVALAGLGRGRMTCVALTVDAGDALIDRIAAEVRPDMFQLHGSETPARAAKIRTRSGLPVIKAISVSAEGDTDAARAYAEAADLILFDAKPPEGDRNALPGGNGLAFDWRLLEPVRGRMRFMLSGGLSENNVAEAIRLTGAAIVDVSSGVESAPGVKDAAMIRRFAAAVEIAAMKEAVNG